MTKDRPASAGHLLADSCVAGLMSCLFMGAVTVGSAGACAPPWAFRRPACSRMSHEANAISLVGPVLLNLLHSSK